jgi:hypothetical protein
VGLKDSRSGIRDLIVIKSRDPVAGRPMMLADHLPRSTKLSELYQQQRHVACLLPHESPSMLAIPTPMAKVVRKA